MANTFTLADIAQHTKEPPVRKLIDEMLKDQNGIFDMVPFAPVDTQTVRNQTWRTVPTMNFRPINQTSYDQLTTTGIDDVVGHVYDLGGKHEIDRIYMMEKNRLRDPRSFEMDRARVGIVRKFNSQFVRGLDNDPDGFAGLDDWLADNPDQILDRSGDPVYADTEATQDFVDDLHELFTYMPENKPDVILTNLFGVLGVNKALRRSGTLDTTTDQWERTFPTFLGVPIVDVGSTNGDRGSANYIIPLHDTDQTDFYAVKFGPDYVTGLQMEGINIDDIGYTDESDHTSYKIVIRWIVGTMITHRYSVAKLANVSFAAS